MPDTNTILEQLDWQTVTCQCEQQPCTQAGGCREPATIQIEFHALDHCNDTAAAGAGELSPFGNYVFLLCYPCFGVLASTVDQYVNRLNQYGRPLCLTCGAPVRILADVIREVKTL